jgi:hypothetical protein
MSKSSGVPYSPAEVARTATATVPFSRCWELGSLPGAMLMTTGTTHSISTSSVALLLE